MNRWRYVGIGFVMMLVLGLLDTWSVFVLPLEKEFGWIRSQTASAYSLAMIFFSLGILLGGPLADHKGTRIISAATGFLLCAGLVLTSLISSLFQLFITYSLLCGIAIGILYNCSISTVVRWFPEKRGLVTGLLMVGSGVGSMLLGIGVTPLFQIFSWRTVFQILGGISLVVIFITGQFLRMPSPDWQGPTRLEGMREQFQAGEGYSCREVIRMPAFWCIWLWHLFVVAGGQSALGHIVPLAVEKGINAQFAAIAMGILAICNAMGRVLFGFLSDRLGRKVTMSLAAMLMAVAMVCMATLISQWGRSGLIIASILTGIAYGGTIPQVSAVVATFFGPRHFGANFGLVSTGIGVAAIIGPYFSGYIKVLTGGYESSLFFLAAIAFISGLLPAVLKVPRALGTN